MDSKFTDSRVTEKKREGEGERRRRNMGKVVLNMMDIFLEAVESMRWVFLFALPFCMATGQTSTRDIVSTSTNVASETRLLRLKS